MATPKTVANPNILVTMDTSGVRTEAKKTQKQIEMSARAYEQGMSKGIAKASRQMARIPKQANTVTAGFQQAGTAISGATASMQVFGTTSNSAIGTVTAAVASMAAQGFNPLGVAIGVASAALGFLVASAGEAETAMDKLAESMRFTSEDAKKLDAQVSDIIRSLQNLSEGGEGTKREIRLKEVNRLLDIQLRLFKSLGGTERDLLRLNDPRAGRSQLGPHGQRVNELRLEKMELEAVRDAEKRLKVERQEATEARTGRRIRSGSDLESAMLGGAGRTDTSPGAEIPSDEMFANAMRGVRGIMGQEAMDAQMRFNLEHEKSVAAAERMNLERLEGIRHENELLSIQMQIAAADEEFAREGERRNAALEESNKLASELAGTFTDTLTQGITDSILEARKLSDVMDNVLRMVLETALLLGIRAAVGGALGPGGLAIPGFRNGGSFTVGGGGGTDSQLVAFKATPGEHVAISRPGQGDGNVTVNVINGSGEKVDTRERRGANGREIDVLIGAVARDLDKGGRVAQAMERSYPLRRAGRLA